MDILSFIMSSGGAGGNGSGSATEVTISTTGDVAQALDAGKIYHFTGELTSLAVTLNTTSGSNAQYHFDFDTGPVAITLTLPNTVVTPDGFVVEADKHYEVDIVNNYAAIASWSLS